MEKRLGELALLVEDPNLWNDRKNAQGLMREKNHLEFALNEFRGLQGDMRSYRELAEMAEADNDNATLLEAEAGLKDIAGKAKKLETEALFSGEADANDCFIEIHAGAGGTESNDWAGMLMRMYLRWAESHGYKADLIDENTGDEAGIKSATLRIEGRNAYGWTKTESGVHRLVRISPFDAAGKRHTSFASIWVYPVVDDSIDIQIEEKDLRVDTYRASGAGGQHVNKTESAIRITHIPTNIVVASQTSRSQHRNRAEAYAMLRARLYELELRKKEEAANATNANKSDIGWGHQIRSYVLQPYQMVKDLRTGYETSNTSGVLNGDLDAMMSASLADRVGKKAE